MNWTPSNLAGQRTVHKVKRRRTPGQRAGLSHARVIAAAQELLAEVALEAFTMRALAERLEVAPNALYSHVDSKTALLDDVLDHVLEEVLLQVEESALGAENPIDGLHGVMASTYAVLLDHRDLVSLYLARQGARGSNAQHLGAIMLELLDRTGVRAKQAQEALRVLIVYTIGFAAFATRPPIEPGSEPVVPAEELRENFDRGLRWLLAGIVAPQAPPPDVENRLPDPTSG